MRPLLLLWLLARGATAKDEDRCQPLSRVKAVADLFGGRVGVRVLALVPDEGKAAAAFRAVAAAFKYPAEFYLVDGPDLVRRAVDQAERLRLYAAADSAGALGFGGFFLFTMHSHRSFSCRRKPGNLHTPLSSSSTAPSPFLSSSSFVTHFSAFV